MFWPNGWPSKASSSPILPVCTQLIIRSDIFRCKLFAETEKYAHVTFFFNGGIEKQYDGEDREMIASPKVRALKSLFFKIKFGLTSYP